MTHAVRISCVTVEKVERGREAGINEDSVL